MFYNQRKSQTISTKDQRAIYETGLRFTTVEMSNQHNLDDLGDLFTTKRLFPRKLREYVKSQLSKVVLFPFHL